MAEGKLIDGSKYTDAWNEQYVSFLHQLKLNGTLNQFALIVCESIPTQIPEGFTLKLGTEMCELLQEWHKGNPYEPWFASPEGPDQSSPNDD